MTFVVVSLRDFSQIHPVHLMRSSSKTWVWSEHATHIEHDICMLQARRAFKQMQKTSMMLACFSIDGLWVPRYGGVSKRGSLNGEGALHPSPSWHQHHANKLLLGYSNSRAVTPSSSAITGPLLRQRISTYPGTHIPIVQAHSQVRNDAGQAENHARAQRIGTGRWDETVSNRSSPRTLEPAWCSQRPRFRHARSHSRRNRATYT